MHELDESLDPPIDPRDVDTTSTRRTSAEFERRWSALSQRYSQIVAIISPPRCSSTAFARVFWEHPQVRYYSHEPFEVTYYDDEGLAAVASKLEAPIDLCEAYKEESTDKILVTKEMPYQVGPEIDRLLDLATLPVIFLMRDPRQNIESRIRKKIEGGESPHYPTVESGWRLLQEQVQRAQARGIPHMLVDAADFRAAPALVFAAVFDRLGLPFTPDLLTWRPCEHIQLDNLDGRHDHLYRRVLASAGILPCQPIPPLGDFPIEHGVRDHVARCLEIYQALRRSPARIQRPASPQARAGDAALIASST